MIAYKHYINVIMQYKLRNSITQSYYIKPIEENVFMELYLAICTTVLILTQIIRVTQNAISLHLNNKEVKKACDWVWKNDNI